MPASLDEAAEILAGARRAVAFTGAGISVDSGIPDFRSAQGLWARFDPMEYAHIDAFRRDPWKIWGMLREMRKLTGGARPNAGHLALAEMETLGVLAAIVTQNVDALHQRAGNARVIEFHGNSLALVCLWCGNHYPAERYAGLPDDGPPPMCECGEVLKPSVVFFGEPIPPQALTDAWAAAKRCDAMLVVGTSAVVYPAAELPALAKRAGAKVIEVNLEETPLTDSLADVTILGSSTKVLPELVALLRARRAH